MLPSRTIPKTVVLTEMYLWLAQNGCGCVEVVVLLFPQVYQLLSNLCKNCNRYSLGPMEHLIKLCLLLDSRGIDEV